MLTAVAAVLLPETAYSDSVPLPTLKILFWLNLVLVGFVIYLTMMFFVLQRNLAREQLEIEQEKSERLLLNVLPASIAPLLKEEHHEVIAEEFEAWLAGHVDSMLAIDGFEAASVERREKLDVDNELEQRCLSVRYVLRDRASLDRYVEHHAAAMRAEAVERFGTRFSAERSLLQDLEVASPKTQLYDELAGELNALLEGERDPLANLANCAAHLYARMPRINWVGFYIQRGDELVLGPFQGRSACVRIPMGSGVCGSAASRRESMVVDDVRAFDGHIACDPASRSEIVLPLVVQERLIGVLDVDSPLPARFDALDRDGLEKVMAVLLKHSDFVREGERL